VEYFFILYRADLANLVNEAALLAGRSNKELVEKIDFIHAVERSIAVWIFLSMFVQSFSYLKPSYYREKSFLSRMHHAYDTIFLFHHFYLILFKYAFDKRLL
jgi:hypothetical protein